MWNATKSLSPAWETLSESFLRFSLVGRPCTSHYPLLFLSPWKVEEGEACCRVPTSQTNGFVGRVRRSNQPIPRRQGPFFASHWFLPAADLNARGCASGQVSSRVRLSQGSQYPVAWRLRTLTRAGCNKGSLKKKREVVACGLTCFPSRGMILTSGSSHIRRTKSSFSRVLAEPCCRGRLVQTEASCIADAWLPS